MQGARTSAVALAIALSLSVHGSSRADEESDRKDEESPAALFASAAAALAADRPSEAIAKLEALGDRGVVDPVVSYDRGLAYAARVRARAEQPGDLGRAAHGFEEARDLSHDRALVRDATNALAEVRAEIARRRARAGDPIELAHGTSPGRAIVKLLSEDAWIALGAVFSLALSIGIVVRARAEARRAKVAGTTTLAVAGGLLLATALIVYSARDYRRNVREAIVVAASARLLDARHVAIAGAAPLPEGTRVRVLEESGEYDRVSALGVEGWVPSSAVLPLAKP
jgi:hypothetical protein